MNLDNLADEIEKKGIKSNSYIEVELGNGETFFGKYSPLGPGGGVHLWNGVSWEFYSSEQIKSLRKFEKS